MANTKYLNTKLPEQAQSLINTCQITKLAIILNNVAQKYKAKKIVIDYTENEPSVIITT